MDTNNATQTLHVVATNHAAERYAERIADREERYDIKAYVAKNMDKINKDIQKMMEHSVHLHHGKTPGHTREDLDVYLSGTWILIVDVPKEKVITLYKIDLGVGEDLNKTFIQRSVEKLQRHQQELEAEKQKVTEEKKSYEKIIDDFQSQIKGMKAEIKKFEKLIEDYKEIIANSGVRYKALEDTVSDDIATIIQQRVYG